MKAAPDYKKLLCDVLLNQFYYEIALAKRKTATNRAKLERAYIDLCNARNRASRALGWDL